MSDEERRTQADNEMVNSGLANRSMDKSETMTNEIRKNERASRKMANSKIAKTK